MSYINESIIKLSQTLADAKWSTQPRILLELCIVKLALDQNGGMSSVPVQNYRKPAELQASGRTGKPAEPQDTAGSIAEEPQAYTQKQEQEQNADRSGCSLQDLDHDKLWHAIFEDGETMKGSFNLLRVGTRLKEVSDSHFIVEAANEVTLAYATENASDLEKLMKKHTGKQLRMECSMADGSGRQEQEKTAEDLANEIGNKFGIHIDIQ